MAQEFDPYDDVLRLLEGRVGTVSGTSPSTGYYVIAIGFSSKSSKSKGKEAARISAHRKLNEMVNGISTSGSTHSSKEMITVSDSEGYQDFFRDEYVNVVNTSFRGNLAAVKEIKTGVYSGEHYVVLMLTESDINNTQKLKAPSSGNQGSGDNTIIIASDSSVVSIAQSQLTEKYIESKGYGSLKLGKTEARKQALTDALNNAVQQAQGLMLQGKSGQFNEAVALAVSMKSEGYISSYEILTDDIERGEFVIKISAEVNSGKLLNDVSFYTSVLGQPVFDIKSQNSAKTIWLIEELERLGFRFNVGEHAATHSFYLNQSQKQVEDHKGAQGIETSLSVTLKDNHTGDLLLTVTNNPMKTRIYVSPLSRAKQVSEHAGYKQLQKIMGPEIIQSLACYSEKGVNYKIVLKNANRNDVALFKHVLNNGTSGNVETWAWDKNGKTMTLDFRYSGPLSEAFDQSLDEIYATFRTEGKGRRPHTVKIDNNRALFKIVVR